jgi:hypothetical protein
MRPVLPRWRTAASVSMHPAAVGPFQRRRESPVFSGRKEPSKFSVFFQRRERAVIKFSVFFQRTERTAEVLGAHGTDHGALRLNAPLIATRLYSFPASPQSVSSRVLGAAWPKHYFSICLYSSIDMCMDGWMDGGQSRARTLRATDED